MRWFRSVFRNSEELALIFGVVLILIVLFAPIPSVALDLAILVNFGLGLTILLMALHVAKPVDFSTFPALLLISTLLRLSLNIAATRLILTDGYAGQVISSIGTFAVGGNFVVGLVIFFILVVVQYVVVTSGAQRVSEVAARFTLDSMPGQQMSIDADLNMGLIDQKEALRRRSALEREASFYGAMDGASKFVKGDAIAGVIILLIDIIAGWIIGVVQMGMAWNEALEHFTLLTIGDGIATQLPALIISTATGIIVTRSSADRELGTEVFRQLTSAPRIPLIVAGILAVLLLLPGMPKWPLIPLIAAVYFGWRHMRRKRTAEDDRSGENEVRDEKPGGVATIAVALGPSISEAWRPTEAVIMDRIASLRTTHEQTFGVAFPAVKFVDDRRLAAGGYEIRIFGARYAQGVLELDKMLAIRGENSRGRLDGNATTDPAFGLPAVWVDGARGAEVRALGYTSVDPLTVFITHLGEVLRQESPTLLTRSIMSELLDDVRARQPGLVEELVPQILGVADVQRVLQNLLAEGVSIAPLDLIVEHLADIARAEKDPGAVTELLRQRLSYAICSRLRERYDDLAVLSLDPRLENQVRASVGANAKKDIAALDPRLAEALLRRLTACVGDMIKAGREPVLLCSSEIRRPMRALTRRTIPKLFVLGVSEIPMNIELRSFAIVAVEEETQRRPASALQPAGDFNG